MKNSFNIITTPLTAFVAVVLSSTLLALPANAKNAKNLKTEVCHLSGFQTDTIMVSTKALWAHIAHGDIVVDADGDGYTSTGACTGGMDDCDDNNPAINPGAEEVCDNGIDDNCNGAIDESCGLSIGDEHEGGIITYIDETGEHGLVMAPPTDYPLTTLSWYNCSPLFDNFSLNGFDDWYLPDSTELTLSYPAINILPNFQAEDWYWSSTHVDLTGYNSYNLALNLPDGALHTKPKYLSGTCTAIRRF